MSDKPKIKFKWLEKLKNVKHIELIIVLIFVVVLILIYTSSFSSSKSKKESTTKSSELTIVDYIDNLETDLEETLSKIKGVENVKVMITLDYKDAIVEDNIINTSTFPNIKGVVIVAKGVENTNVKLNVLKAVEAVIEINSGCIEILSSN